MGLKYKFNVFTGNFDLVNEQEIYEAITHELNDAGTPLVVMDLASGHYLSLGPITVVDENGNHVVALAAPVSEIEEVYDGGGSGDFFDNDIIDGGDVGNNSNDILDGGGASV